MLLPLVCLLLLPTFSAADGHCHADDRAALLGFKSSIPGPDPFPLWIPASDCCEWYGVQCNETTGYVYDLYIIDDSPPFNLNDTIPFLAKLKHLQILEFHKLPNLTGTIPSSIQELTQLTYLIISWTNVSGPVPDSLKNLKNLEYLNLSFNRLSGTIPPSLGTLPVLNAVDLSRNQLTGPIPESFGHFQGEIPYLVLSHNLLSGDIPASLSKVNFSSVDISRNNLSGDASVFFGKGKATYTIIISRNSFAFNFSKVSFMESLVELDISHNRIYGDIPQQIVEADQLQMLNVSYNRLCGRIPTGWKLKYRSDNFDSSSYVHNRCLCGTPLEPCQ